MNIVQEKLKERITTLPEFNANVKSPLQNLRDISETSDLIRLLSPKWLAPHRLAQTTLQFYQNPRFIY